MNTKNILVAFAIAIVTTSCVSKVIFEEEQSKKKALALENATLRSQLDGLVNGNSSLSLERLKKQAETLSVDKTRIEMELAAIQNRYDTLKKSYDALVANTDENLQEIIALNRTLLEQLETKERELNLKEAALLEKESSIQNAQRDLDVSLQRVVELEAIIAAKDAKMRALKEAISKALTTFEGNGLTVEQRDGNVYVSMQNKLLFESGSWAVNSRGREAVEALGSVLADNKEIAVLIEGHTDNVPFGGRGAVTNNWELSTKRATEIVAILIENTAITKENITAAGRGEYAPIDSNISKEGRAKNRRIEVVLTPKLDEINKLLNKL
ncbi:MAG: chemotaxis protein MotB [Patiriisocius sp.]|jgi:chemotaxis protein MotB